MGVRQARGHYLAYLDDDLYLPDHLARFGALVIVRLRDDASNMSSVMRPEGVKAARLLER